MDFDSNLKELNIDLPKAADPVGSYVETKITGNLLYISGQISMNENGELIKGKLGKELNILEEIIKAQPTDGLWDDGRTDTGQLGLTYQELEDAMNNSNSPHRTKYLEKRKLNLHKMGPIPVCKIPN